MRGHRSPSYHLFYFSVNLEYAKYKVWGEDIMVIVFFFFFVASTNVRSKKNHRKWTHAQGFGSREEAIAGGDTVCSLSLSPAPRTCQVKWLGFLFWWLNLQVWPLTRHPGRVLTGPCTPHPQVHADPGFQEKPYLLPTASGTAQSALRAGVDSLALRPLQPALSPGREDAKRATVSTLHRY